jgi:formate dehydrogenase iron-sulfur subunit
MYGEREEILAEAHRRLEALKARYPKARLYGETEAGGLAVIVVLPDEPETLDLPANPEIPAMVTVWQQAVQPTSLLLTGFSLIVSGAAAFIARRNHKKELERLHEHHDAATTTTALIPEHKEAQNGNSNDTLA